jgi:hypothetical protein
MPLKPPRLTRLMWPISQMRLMSPRLVKPTRLMLLISLPRPTKPRPTKPMKPPMKLTPRPMKLTPRPMKLTLWLIRLRPMTPTRMTRPMRPL